MLCPCHSGETYEKCCKRYHEGELAPTPEKLMRSRYSAYALSLADYIIKTQEEKTSKEDVLAFCESTEFRGLEILKVEPTRVCFHAILFHNGQDGSFTEMSLFRRVKGGGWIYLKSEFVLSGPPPAS